MPTGALVNTSDWRTAVACLRSMPANLCLGSIGVSEGWNAFRKYGTAAFSLNTTVSGSGVSTDSRSPKCARPREWCGRTMSSTENFTSAEVNGWPSCQRTPLRSLKVYVSPLGATVHDTARPGAGFISGPSQLSRLSKIFVDTIATGTAVDAMVDSAEGSGWKL